MNEEEQIFLELNQLKNTGNFSCAGSPYTVPCDYFDLLPEKIIKRINISELTNELASISPDLLNIPKNNVYEIPAGYFEQNSFQPPVLLNKKTAIIRQAKWVKIAAAVLIIVFLSSTWYLYNMNNVKFADAERLIEKASDGQLEGFLYDGVVSTRKNRTNQQIDENYRIDYNQLFKSIPDIELKNFLDETSDDDEMFTLN